MDKIGKMESSLEKLLDLVVLSLPSVAIGLVILIVGRYVIGFTTKLISKRFERRQVDLTIRSFVLSLIKFVCYGLLILTVANTMGIQTTSFIAILSAFGLAVGMALQGSLSNFAGGVLVLVFRPFEVGDAIESANGSSGTVEKIDLLYTTLLTDDGITVFSPNGSLANSVIKNFTKIGNRRMQFAMVLSYDTNVQVARQAILTMLAADARVLTNPAPSVHIGDLTEGGMQLVIRAWSKREDFWSTKGELAEALAAVVEDKSVVLPQSSIRVLSDV